jgi:hypothetical protein
MQRVTSEQMEVYDAINLLSPTETRYPEQMNESSFSLERKMA